MKLNVAVIRRSPMMLLLLLGACATGGHHEQDPEQLVQQRAQERWDFLLADQFEEAYAYLSPAQRSRMSLTDYLREQLNRKVRWVSATSESADCEEDICTVTVNMQIVVRGAVPGVSQFKLDREGQERWVRDGDTWYFVPE